MVLEEIMSADPIAGAPGWTLRQVMSAFHDHDIRHLPVVDGGNIVGMVSDRDLRQQMRPAAALYQDADRAREWLETSVVEFMQGDVLTLSPEDDVTEAIDLMTDNKVGAVPVVRSGTSELVGIVSYIDVLRAARDLFTE